MSKYTDWMEQQEQDFILEICRGHRLERKFIDYNFRPITLEELKQLDRTYILREAVLSDQQGGAQETK